LEEIGGFTQYAEIEDLPTSIELHARGYKSIYLNKDLCAGLSPESCEGYLNQRKRWTRAAMQIFLLKNPLFKKGLTVPQKLNYFATLYYFFLGIPRIIINAWPLTHLLIDIPPIVTTIIPILHYFAAYQLSITIAMNCFTERHRNFFFNDVYETIVSFPIAAAALSALFRPKKLQVTVTPKGEKFEKSHITRSLFPHMVLLGLLILGLGRGLSKINIDGLDDPGRIICAFWGAYNILVLLIAIISARELPQHRSSFRIDKQIKVELSLPDKVVSCVTREISDTGCCVILTKPEVLPNSEITLKLIGDSIEIADLKGKITRYDREEKRKFNLGIQFVDIDEATRQKIIRLIYSPADSWQEDHLPTKSIWSLFSTFLNSPLVIFVKDQILRRFTPRFNLALFCEIVLADKTIAGKTKNISTSGLLVNIPGNNELPEEIDITLMRQDKTVKLRGKVISNTPRGEETRIGVEFLEPYQGKNIWKELGY
jgi:cellulose synthase (UDP-forming)